MQSPKDRDIAEQYATLLDEVASLRVEVASERQKRIAAEAIADERQKQINREVERSLSAEKSRDDVLKLISAQNAAAQSEKPQLDPKNFQPIHRRKREDPWFDQKFMSALERIRRGEKTEVPEPPEGSPVQ